MPQCQSPFLELMFLVSKNILQGPGNRWPKALPKICQNSGFFIHISRYNSALVRENTGQGKPVSWHILRSAEFNEPLLW